MGMNLLLGIWSLVMKKQIFLCYLKMVVNWEWFSFEKIWMFQSQGGFSVTCTSSITAAFNLFIISSMLKIN